MMKSKDPLEEMVADASIAGFSFEKSLAPRIPETSIGEDLR